MKSIRDVIVFLICANIWIPEKVLSQEHTVRSALTCLHDVTEVTALEKAQACFEIASTACFVIDPSKTVLQSSLGEAACHRENVSIILEEMRAFANDTSDDVTEITRFIRKSSVDRSVAVINAECAHHRAILAGGHKPWLKALTDEETASLDRSEGLCLMSHYLVHYWRVVVLNLVK